MHCPYCQQSVEEESAECRDCGLRMDRLDGVLGLPPVLTAGLTDRVGVLSHASERTLRRAIRQFEERFPQIRLAVLLDHGPVVIPLRTWAWWLFNRARVSAALDKGYVNRDILLVIDPHRHQAALTIGYGLEPFVGPRELSRILDPAVSILATGMWQEGCSVIIGLLEANLKEIVQRIPTTYGVAWPEPPAPLSSAQAAAPW